MGDALKPLKPNDEVYIKSLNAHGKVVRVRPGDIGEPEEERFYEIQVEMKYFCRTDLELDTTKADMEERRKSRAEKAARAEAAQERLIRENEAGNVKPATVVEAAIALDAYLKEIGSKGFLQPIKPEPGK